MIDLLIVAKKISKVKFCGEKEFLAFNPPLSKRFPLIRTIPKTLFLKVLILSIPFVVVCLFDPQIEGDASEYLMMQQSFLNHGSPEYRDGDLHSYEELIRIVDSEQLTNWFRFQFHKVVQNEPFGGGYALGNGGDYYCYHFFLYSLLSVPFRVLVDLMGLNPLLSFTLLNACLLSFAVFVVLQSKGLIRFEKLFLVIQILGSCFVFYFTWIHPEVFTASFVLAGVVLFWIRSNSEKRCCVSRLPRLKTNPSHSCFLYFLLQQLCNVGDGRDTNFLKRFLLLLLSVGWQYS